MEEGKELKMLIKEEDRSVIVGFRKGTDNKKNNIWWGEFLAKKTPEDEGTKVELFLSESFSLAILRIGKEVFKEKVETIPMKRDQDGEEIIVDVPVVTIGGFGIFLNESSYSKGAKYYASIKYSNFKKKAFEDLSMGEEEKVEEEASPTF